MNKRLLAVLSIVERDKGQKLIKLLQDMGIRMNFQCVGFGTAPTEMMDIFGIGSNDKDIIISIASDTNIKDMMSDFGANVDSNTKFGGLMIVVSVSAAGRVLTELLTHNSNNSGEKGNDAMKNEHQNNLIIISINEGYADSVMQVARKAGATGGTVIKGRLADAEFVSELKNTQIDEEREILVILAPLNTSKQIMEDVNREFGMSSKANGIITAIPTEKAFKI
ncbi:MAG: hypothetical protein E7396_02160 [Ruminococcaceae bacterium]|nr:hypothetical protein [Oscillospiraceae bacterium]